MKAQNLILSLLAAAVIAAAPAAAMAADAEQASRPCPRHMIGCEHGVPHKACPGAEAKLTEEQKAELKAQCEAKRAELKEKRAELAKKAAERKAQREKLIKEHHAAVAPLHKKLVQKQMELDVLSPNPNVKPDELKAIVAEIVSLRTQLHTLQKEFRADLAKSGLKCGKPFRGDCGPRGPHGEGWHNGHRPHHPEAGWHDAPRHGGCPAMR